ncbi:MAG: carbamoyl-phosphate synthase large subunit [Deferribacterota bacterium]|nr:carbamoyl-phosphate synthase large subunit [Deferribacterota bacterium]
MPKRKDLKSVLIIGSGPIVIGQACEFDYSGTQAIKALKEEGLRIVLVNSNPATIMTDPELADATYIEPLDVNILEKIIKKERPDCILPTVGGQTALNLALELDNESILERYSVELIGANIESIKKAEDRDLFKMAMSNINLDIPKSFYVKSYNEALDSVNLIGFPVIIRPSFTLGGTGGNVAYNIEEFKEYIKYALNISPVNQALIEESVLGWKEFELEVMRDLNDNVVIICSIENFDPMGVHTGDSITVAPAQTLSDVEYQNMRNGAIKIMREIGVDTGGSNVQFAVNPNNGRQVVIEMNPRVSRSSALASKATGFPIAKIAAKLAIGYTLDEIPNDITKKTPSSFEPTIDYTVVKIPRFTFEKFPGTKNVLSTYMKSVGEVMAIGRNFKESLQKALSSLEINSYGLESILKADKNKDITDELINNLKTPNDKRIYYIADALRRGLSTDEVYDYTKIDRWFLEQINEIITIEDRLMKDKNFIKNTENLKFIKSIGFTDKRIALLTETTEANIKNLRRSANILPTYKRVDTCAAEFESFTPYMYSSYEDECEIICDNRKKIIILGSGPNRIGQGIEFDYCCVHASMALREEGIQTIMINCNPETVSTDYDISDKLYFEPLTYEHVINIVEKEKPYGVIVQLGGQTPLKLSNILNNTGVNILGTSPNSINIAEDRELFKELINKLRLKQPDNGIARNYEEALAIANKIGYPVVVRPSYVLGGRAMEIVYDEHSLEEYIEKAVYASEEHPVLIDKFLENALELDVDAISDGIETYVAAIMEHIEEAGIHSGDSACSIPSRNIDYDTRKEIERQTKQIAKELNIIGLLNIQFAVKGSDIFVLEVNPRASRTIPYVSKSIGIPLAKIATKIMIGKKLKEFNININKELHYYTVKEAVFPFNRFLETDPILGPEMRSTGEVMGIDENYGMAYFKAQMSAFNRLPKGGTVFISVKDSVKTKIYPIAKKLLSLGFKIVSTKGTYNFLKSKNLIVSHVLKVNEGRPNIVDLIKNGDIDFVINVPEGKKSRLDTNSIRSCVIRYNIPYVTTVEAADASVKGIEAFKNGELKVKSLQEYYKIYATNE